MVSAVQSSTLTGTIKSGTTSFSILLQFKQKRDFSILFTFWVTSLPEEVTLVSFFLFFLSCFCFTHLARKCSGEPQ